MGQLYAAGGAVGEHYGAHALRGYGLLDAPASPGVSGALEGQGWHSHAERGDDRSLHVLDSARRVLG